MTCTNHSLSSTHAHGILREYCHAVKHRARVMKTSDSLCPALFPPADVKFSHLNKMPPYFISSYSYCANRVTNCSTAVCLQGFSKEALSGGAMFYLRSWIEFFKEV